MPAVSQVIEAFRAAYRDSGGDLWIAPRLPGLMRAEGLTVDAVRPELQAGAPGSPPWRWVERFLFEHVDTVLASGHLAPADWAAFDAQWAAALADPDALLFTPIQVTVRGRLPQRVTRAVV